MRDLTVLITAAGNVYMPGTTACLRNNGERRIRIVGADMSDDATILQMCDAAYQVPRGSDPGYIDARLDICRDEHVDILLPIMSAELESLSYLDYMQDFTVEEEDGWRILYRYADAAGLEGCKTVYFYAPGAPVYRLPESFISWYGCIRPLEDSDLALPGWGMMNGEDGQGFAA